MDDSRGSGQGDASFSRRGYQRANRSNIFSGHFEVNSDELSRVPQVKLQPGMPVEATIITGRRTMLAFLLQPITDSFAHAFREE